MSTTIRVTSETRDRLADLAHRTGQPMTQVVEDAVKAHARTVFFRQVNQRYSELRDDPEEWAAIEAERDEWALTLRDQSL